MLDNDVFVIEHTLPPHNDVFTAPAVFFHYEGWGVFKSKETLAAQLRIAAVLLRKTGRSRPLFASFQFICRIEGSKWDFSDYRNYFLNNIVMNNTEDLCGAMWFVPPLILASSLLGLIIYAGNTFGKYSKKHSILIKNIIICLAGICLFLGNERMELKFMLDYRLDVSLFVIPLLVLAYFINTYVKDFSKYLKGYIAIPCFICTIYLAYKCGYRPLLAGQMVGIKSFYFYL